MLDLWVKARNLKQANVKYVHFSNQFDSLITIIEILIGYDLCTCWLMDSLCAWIAALYYTYNMEEVVDGGSKETKVNIYLYCRKAATLMITWLSESVVRGGVAEGVSIRDGQTAMCNLLIWNINI